MVLSEVVLAEVVLSEVVLSDVVLADVVLAKEQPSGSHFAENCCRERAYR